LANNYDNAAHFYDQLSQLVFGKALVNAQVYLLQFVPPGSNLLIVGGGTGWILEELTRLHHGGLSITYVELSAKMVALSKQKNTGNNEVKFINSAIEDADLTTGYDIIITPFLFDNFKQPHANKVFSQLNALLTPNGLWLYADFELNGKWWQSALLKTMHLFFKLLCRVEASKLPEVKALWDQNRYQQVQSKGFFGGFIRSAVYEKLM